LLNPIYMCQASSSLTRTENLFEIVCH